MIKEAIDRVLQLGKQGMVHEEKDGRRWLANGQGEFKPVGSSRPVPISAATLAGLKDFVLHALPGEYVVGKPEQEDAEGNPIGDEIVIEGYVGIYAHITGHDKVSLISELKEPWLDRHTLLEVTPHAIKGFEFERYHAMENFIVSLQASFHWTADREKILSLAGSITAGTSAIADDDGVSQKVTVKRGVHLKGEEKLPNPVTLAPRRGFPELPEIQSEFVLRVRDRGDTPELALYEADGGAWQLEARENLKAWILENIPGLPVIS